MLWPFEFRLLQGPYATQQRNFEELCTLLLKSKNPTWKVIPRESPDWGIDFLAKSRKKIIAYQCKFFIDNFGKSQLKQIDKSIEKAIKYKNQINWSEYVVCIPRNLTGQEHDTIGKIGEKYRVELSILQASDIWALLSESPSVQYAFFPVRNRNLISPGLHAAYLISDQFKEFPDKTSIGSRALPISLNPLNNRSRGLLLKAAGDLLSISGEYEHALAYYLEAEHFLNFSLDKTDILRAISMVYSKSGQNDLAFQFLKRAQKFTPAELKDSLKIDYAEYLLLQRKYSQAQREIIKGLELSKKLGKKDEVARAYTVKADLAFDAGDWEQANKCYKSALKIWQQLGDNYNVATVLSYLGSVLHRQGHLSDALERLRESVKLFEYEGDLPALAEALTSLGMVLFEMGEWYSSQQYHHRCLQIERTIQNIRGQAICFNNLGLLARVQGNYDESISYHQKALELSKQLRDKRGITYSNSYLGLVYLDRNELDVARGYFNSANKLARKIPFRFGEALSYLNLAQLAIKAKKSPSAIKLARKGYEEVKKVGGAIEKARACRILAEVYFDKGVLNKAIKYAKRSLIQFQRSKAPYERALSLLVLSKIQIKLKDVQSAKQNRAHAEGLLSKLGAGINPEDMPNS